MKAITILIAGLLLPCTPALRAQAAPTNALVSGNTQTRRQHTERIFTANHRLYWKYRVPVSYGAQPQDEVFGRQPVQTVVIEPLGTRRNPVPDITLLSGICPTKKRTSPAWNEWLLPRSIPPTWTQWWTGEATAAHVVFVLFEF